jgi:hypothetical protein
MRGSERRLLARSLCAVSFAPFIAMGCSADSVPRASVTTSRQALEGAGCRTILMAPERPSSMARSEMSFFDPISLTLPGSFSATEGNNGNHRLVLTFAANAGPAATCEWQPNKKDHAPDRKYELVGCSNGAHEGDAILADFLRLEMKNGEQAGSINLPLVERGPCAIDGWIASRPHFERMAEGFAEHVTFVTDVDKYVVRANGVVQSVAEFQANEDLAIRARFGALSPDLYQLANSQQTPPDIRVPVAIWYEEPVNWTDLTPRLASSNPTTQTAAQNDLRAAIATRSAALAPMLGAAGLVDVVSADTLPLISGNATPAAIRALASRPELKSVELAAPKAIALLEPSNATTDAHIDSIFNAPPLSLFGDGLAIGNFGELNPSCMMYQDHRRFEFANVVHNTLSFVARCGDDRDCCVPCDIGCPPTGDPPVSCVKIAALGGTKRCVVKHTTATSSGVSAAVDGAPYSAAKAKLLEYNDQQTNCVPRFTELAYGWFRTNGASTAWESFVCQQVVPTGSTDEPIVNDRYARDYGFAIFKAADNVFTAPACRSSLNSICVGAHTAATSIWDEGDGIHASSWHNREGTDREEPDVTAIGKSVNTAWPVGTVANSTTVTADVTGTSIATPIAAAMALLMKEKCGAPNLDPRLVRSILRTAAWSRNPEGWLYSTPGILAPDGTLYDHKDGGGAPMAENIAQFCGTGTGAPPTASGTLNVDLVGTPSMPPFTLREVGADAPPGGTGKGPPDSGGSASTDAKVPGTNLGAPYWTADLGAGKRVRTTFSWDACPVGSTARAAVDFDVFLCNQRPTDPSIKPYCFYASGHCGTYFPDRRSRPSPRLLGARRSTSPMW